MEDLQTEPYVMISEVEPGVAEVTINIYDEDHKFDLWVEGDTAKVSYEETLSFRGQIRVSEPDEDIFKSLVVSDEMTAFLDEHDCESVKRAEPQP
jgi:hypothetical protein